MILGQRTVIRAGRVGRVGRVAPVAMRRRRPSKADADASASVRAGAGPRRQSSKGRVDRVGRVGRCASSAAVNCDLDRGGLRVQARIALSLRGPFCNTRPTRTLATRRVVCRANRIDRFRVPFTEPARSGSAGDRLSPRLNRTCGSGLQRFQGFRPALGAEQGAQAGTDFVFHTRFEPIETYTINARHPWSPKHSDTHEALKSRRSETAAIAIPTASESAIPCTLQIGGLNLPNRHSRCIGPRTVG
jgi:hypothetical protein